MQTDRCAPNAALRSTGRAFDQLFARARRTLSAGLRALRAAGTAERTRTRLAPDRAFACVRRTLSAALRSLRTAVSAESRRPRLVEVPVCVPRRNHRATFVALVCASGVSRASDGCLEWRGGLGVNGTSHPVRALTTFDDGSGNALYLGGSFVSAGDVSAVYVARWNGSSWSEFGEALNAQVNAFAAWDDGSGPALWAGGNFTTVGASASVRIAGWNGTSWILAPQGPNAAVNALAAFDDGTGSALYVGGDFTTVAGSPIVRIARYDGTSWTAVGSGASQAVRALCVYDDGSGPALFAAGDFLTMDGVAASRIARFDGTSWSALGAGLNGVARALHVHDDGTGPKLVVGGEFTLAGGVPSSRVASWDGTTWAAVGGGIDGTVNALTTFDDGAGPKLCAAGDFTTPAERVARFDGGAWTSIGTSAGVDGSQLALASFDDGGGARLYSGGSSTSAGGVVSAMIASTDGAQWSALGIQSGVDSTVQALDSFDAGSGAALYACGYFDVVGGVDASYMARWDGTRFVPLQNGPSNWPLDMEVYDDGFGAQLYVAGNFSTVAGVPAQAIARWSGSTWSTLGGGIEANQSILALQTFDDGTGPGLYLAGTFVTAGGSPAARIARYDAAGWHTLGAGINGTVTDLCVFDDGTGPALYAGGLFSTAGTTSASSIARWDGSTWTALGAGIGGRVSSLCVHDDGSGPALYVGGDFTGAGSTTAIDIARWDGSTWSVVPGLFNASEVMVLGTFDDGSGEALYAGGVNATLPTPYTLYLQRWNGSVWTSVGPGLGGASPRSLNELHAFDDGTGPGPSLWVGGRFIRAGERASYNIAAWQGCTGTGAAYCFGDGSATACPCGNASVVGAREGCVNSTGAAGRLRASGSASLASDTLVLDGAQMTSGTALYFQGTTRLAAGAGAVFGDGLRCAGGAIVRLDITANTSGASSFPAPGGPSVSLKGLIAAPGTRTYQVWFRDAASFCTIAPFNLTNAVEIAWEL